MLLRLPLPWLLSTCLSAADPYLIAAETFDAYQAGAIAGQGAASDGWTSVWQGDAMPNIKAASAPTPIDYLIPTRGKLSSGPGCLELTTSPEPVAGSKSVTRSFTPIKADLFIGFTFQIPVIGSGTDRVTADLLDSAGGLIQRLILEPVMNTFNPGNYGYTGGGSSGGTNLPDGNNSTVYFAVFEVRRSEPNWKPSVWMNPADWTNRGSFGVYSPNPNPAASVRFSVSSTDEVGPFTTVRIDNLRIGLTWDSVVPPLPANAEFPNFAFEQAHRIIWYGASTHKYRIEASADMKTWTPFTTAYTNGANKNMEVYVPKQGSERFFRVVSLPK